MTWRKIQTSRSEDYYLTEAGSSPMPWCDTIASIYSSHAGVLLGRIETDVCRGGYAKARAFDQAGLHWLNVKTIQTPMRFGAKGRSQVMTEEASVAGGGRLGSPPMTATKGRQQVLASDFASVVVGGGSTRSVSPLRTATNGRQQVMAQEANIVGGSNRRSASPPTVRGRDGGLPSSTAQGPLMTADGTLTKQRQIGGSGSGSSSHGVDVMLGRSGVAAGSARHLVMFKTVASFGEFSLSRSKRVETAFDDYELRVTEHGKVTNHISTPKPFSRCETSQKY